MSPFERRTTTVLTYASIPGTAGELAQGYVDGEYFLVTNPINLYSTVVITASAGDGTVSVHPSFCSKARRASALTLQLLNIRQMDVDVHITSQIPVGKGMASSTADIVAVVEATAKAFNCTVSPEQISTIALAIEPSDGLMYKGIVCYNHRQGKLLEQFGVVPMSQLVIDLGGTIDTLAFNQIPKNYSPSEIAAFAEIVSLLREGIKKGNLALIGQAATQSCQINQRLLFKPELDIVLDIATNCGAFGVACAHSGTILSLIFSSQNADGIVTAQNEIAGRFEQRFNLMHVQSVFANAL